MNLVTVNMEHFYEPFGDGNVHLYHSAVQLSILIDLIDLY